MFFFRENFIQTSILFIVGETSPPVFSLFVSIYFIAEDPSNKARLLECLEGILNRAQDAPKSKKVGIFT